jgi:hypothetical protein
MRGGVTVNDLLDRYSFEDRELLYKVINDNFENTKNSGITMI